MSIIVNTNMAALKTQRNLTTSTNSLSKALERMSTGLKINSAADDAAGLFVATNLDAQIRGSKVAQSNIATGINVLQIVEGNYSVIQDNLLRIRDLATQAANGIYNEDSIKAMQDEVEARVSEIDRVADAANFNGLELLSGKADIATKGMRLQVGANSEASTNSITIPAEIFKSAHASSLGLYGGNPPASKPTGDASQFTTIENAFVSASTAAQFIKDIDVALTSVASNKATIGAIQNRLESANDSLTTTIENATSAKSTIMDADIAEESANYTKAQILQQTASTLLVQANALPQIAINLIRQ